MISYIKSKGPNPGIEDGPHEYNTIAFSGINWREDTLATVDHNYDFGSLYFEQNKWMTIAPTGNYPYEFNTGGELEIWEKSNYLSKWTKKKRLTTVSDNNHSYPRKPINYNRDFMAFWADGNPREPSASRLHFSNYAGEVFTLPEKFPDGINQFKIQPDISKK